MGQRLPASSPYDSDMSEEPARAPKASVISWLVLVLLCVSAVAALILRALRSG